jgi:hypothetical protein
VASHQWYENCAVAQFYTRLYPSNLTLHKEPLKETLHAHSKDVKSCLGLTLSDKQNSFWVFRYLCDQLGLKTSVKKRKNKVIEVWIDEDWYSWVMELLERRRIDREYANQLLSMENVREEINETIEGIEATSDNEVCRWKVSEKVFVNLGFKMKEGLILQINSINRLFNVLCDGVSRWVSEDNLNVYCPL